MKTSVFLILALLILLTALGVSPLTRSRVAYVNPSVTQAILWRALFVDTIFFKEIEKSGMIEPHYTK